MEKNYSPKEIEEKLFDKWIKNKYFTAKVNKDKKPFTIVMPPPNVTGRLHMGHALDNTMQDILIRYKRMSGFEALWIPGTDHASISTEVKVINALKEEGIDKKDLGREKFLERAWAWKEEYGGEIVRQLKKLGASCDWDRERFTMDEGLSKAVLTNFVNLYNKGLIYRGNKIINWCPECKTSISDAEVIHEEKAGKFYHINYKVENEDTFIEIATTRPETLLGDTAVAVNPKDVRYKHLVGKMLELPLTDRKIPIIADEYVDMEFGTGAVKITPAHDPNDFLVGERHKLPQINILNDDATMNEKCGKYVGLDRFKARKMIVSDLEEMGLLVKTKEYVHNVGTHDRCGSVVEPLIKAQWFVKMEELIKPAKEAIEKGDIRLVPKQIEKTYFNWVDNIRDWCISRQLWWGHRIPVYYCDECSHVNVSEKTIDKCEKCGGSVRQDEDTLDTWFSSALWPFSTLGWPENNEELEYFYPTSVLVTGYDIIFFWVIRMIFSGYEVMGKKPFSDVVFHGLVRDSKGRKMSKSLGNGVDPLDVIKEYGVDALRASLISNTSPGNDMRYYDEKVSASRNFANKIWNSSRFIMMNEEGKKVSLTSVPSNLTDADKWILSKANTLAKEVTENIEKYEFGIAYDKIEAFAWDEFCDWYVEMVKARLYDENDNTKEAAIYTLKTVLIYILKLLHPFMPFITEEIYCAIQDEEETIVISKWPEYEEKYEFKKEENAITNIKEAIKAVRNIRMQKKVAPSKKLKIYIKADNDETFEVFNNAKQFISLLARASETIVSNSSDENIPKDAIKEVIHNATVYISLSDLVDIKEELKRLEEEKERLIKEVARCENMLNNEKFMSKAPIKKQEEEKQKREEYILMLEKVKENIASLSNL